MVLVKPAPLLPTDILKIAYKDPTVHFLVNGKEVHNAGWEGPAGTELYMQVGVSAFGVGNAALPLQKLSQINGEICQLPEEPMLEDDLSWTFVVLGGCGAAAYLLGGVYIGKKQGRFSGAAGLQLLEVHPHWQYLSALPSLVGDGFKLSVRWLGKKGLRNQGLGRWAGGYEIVPTSDVGSPSKSRKGKKEKKRMEEEAKKQRSKSKEKRERGVAKEEGKAPKKKGSASSSAAASEPSKAAASYAKGQSVEYFSKSKGKWIPAKVIKLHSSGVVDLDVKAGVKNAAEAIRAV